MKTLDDAIKAFLAPSPYAARRIVENDGRDHIFVWDKYVEPPDDFGLIAGDAIHNLRSSLDHLAVALAVSGADAQGVSITTNEVSRIQFPIVLAESDFNEQIKRGRLKYVAKAAEGFIEGFQPYRMTPAAPEWSNLYVLSELDNADKHRLLTTAGLASTVLKVGWPPALDDTQLENPEPPSNQEVGAEICRFVFSSPQREEDLQVEFLWGFTLFVGTQWRTHDIRYIIGNYISTVRLLIARASHDFLP
jgi:hypothetical protein